MIIKFPDGIITRVVAFEWFRKEVELHGVSSQRGRIMITTKGVDVAVEEINTRRTDERMICCTFLGLTY
jgi:hypothetical protein